MPLEYLRLGLIARPATVNLVHVMLDHVTRKARGRLQSLGPLCRWVVVHLGMLTSLVEATATTRVAPSLTNVRSRQVATNTFLVLRQLSNVEGWRILLPRDHWQWRACGNVYDHTHTASEAA